MNISVFPAWYESDELEAETLWTPAISEDSVESRKPHIVINELFRWTRTGDVNIDTIR